MKHIIQLTCLALLMPWSVHAQPPAGPFRVLQSISLPGNDGWDYLTLDAENKHLFITRGSHVQVVAPDTGTLIRDLTGMQGVHGVALAGARAYISDGNANSVIVIDRASLRRLGAIRVGQGPDGILYDPFSRRVFTFDGRGNDATAIDVASGKAVGHVALGGRPEAAATDGQGHLFVNLESRSAVAVIDSSTLRVTASWSLAPCQSPSGIALDSAHQRLFSGCRNKLLAVSDTRAGRVVTTVPIGAGVDANRFDAGEGLIFSSNGFDGTLTVVQELTPDRYALQQNLTTMSSARTMDLDPVSHRIYLVGAQMRPFTFPTTQAPPAGRPPQRPTMIPGTFRLLIAGQ
jgi:YVTN family beta-propeller protein